MNKLPPETQEAFEKLAVYNKALLFLSSCALERIKNDHAAFKMFTRYVADTDVTTLLADYKEGVLSEEESTELRKLLADFEIDMRALDANGIVY
ncbi:hypothetical protein [Anaerobiospirillum sp. NML120449]|uniref:hypothetical protein n=1 Tax=Anaerobiospirillum sp. NML120449 TaxID=2932817 RepID=UPI001FF4C62E|nr:hypothetical protein [Anaerobiospirillum sp. NML120449]MCK0525399.1 hypothetical protein [Anaerobiospirillum sp. NML120449]